MQFNNLQSNQPNNTYNASFAPNTAADANQQQQPQPQDRPVHPFENAADLSSHPSARNLQNYSSIRSIEGAPGRFVFDHLSQPAKLEAIEAALRQYDTLNAEEKTKIIAAAVQFINSVRIDAKPYEKVTLFIGQTGAGKSTLINYLAGAEIKGKWDEELKTVSLDIPKMLKDIRVGHGAASCTFAPMPYEDTATGLVYFDCPGFMDSRGILHEIIAAKLIQDVIRNAEKVNFVITLTESCLADRGHIRVLKETIDVLATYAPDFEASKNSMLLVVTKGANNKNFGEPGDEEDDIKYFKAKVAGKSGILNELDKELSAYQKAFLQFIHNTGRFTYSFKADIKKDTPVSNAERGRIIRKIQELELVPHQEISGIKVSRDAELRSIEFAQHIKTCLNGLSEQVAETAFKNIADFCSQKVEAGADLFDQDITALQAMLKKLQRAVIPLVTKQYDTAEVFFENLQALLTTNDIHLAEDTLQAMRTILADIKGHESAQSLFRKICDLDIEASNTKLMFTQGFIPLSQTLKRLIPACDALQAYQPIKPGLPYMEKFADEAENTVKVEMLLKHAQDYEKLGHFQDAEDAYTKALKHTDSAEHYKLYAACLSEIYLALSRIPLTPEKDVAKEKAYQEKASRAFYYLGELYTKEEALKDAQAAYKASCDLALHEAPLQALLDVARQLEETAEIAGALEKLADFYEQKGTIPLAIDKLEEAFEVLPSVKILQKLEALYGKDGGEDQQSKLDKTRIMRFELQISQEPKNIELYRDYGWFLKSIGKHNEARAVKKRIDVQLQAIQRELFQGLQENLQALQQKIVKQKTKIGGLKQTIHLQDEKIHSQAGKLETLEEQLQGSAKGSSAAIDDLQKKLISLETIKLPEQANSIHTLNTQLETWGKQVQTNATGTHTAIDGLQKRLVSVETIKLPEQAESIRTLNTQLNKINSLNTQLENFDKQVKTNATGTHTAIDGLQKRLVSLETVKLPEQANSIRTLNTQLETLRGQVQTNATRNDTAHTALQTRVASFETVKLPEQANSIRTLNTQLETLRGQVQANATRNDTAHTALQTRVATLQGKIGTLETLERENLSQQVLQVLQVLQANPEKTDLSLAHFGTRLTDTSLRYLAGFTRLTTLNLSSCSQLTDAGLQYLAGLTQLTTLTLSGCNQLSDAGLQHLARLTRLTTLDLSSCSQLTGAGLQHLAGLTQLTTLTLNSCSQLTDAGLQYLAGLTQLTTLNLSGCNQLSDAGLQHLAGLTQLTTLNLSGCNQLSDAGLQHLARLTQLTILSLGGCNQLSDAGLQHLARLTRLTALYLDRCNQLSDAGLRHLAGLTRLTSFNLQGCTQLTSNAKEQLKRQIPGLNIY